MSEFDALDLSFLKDMEIPEMDGKTTKKETIDMPQKAEELEGEEGHAPIADAEEVESFEELLEKQKGTSKEGTKEVADETKTEETVETVEDVIDETKTDETTEEVSAIKAWAEWAKEKGLVEYEDKDFEDSEEFLEKVYVNKVKKDIEEYKESLPEVIKQLVNNYEEGVPLLDLIESESRRMNYVAITKDEIDADEKLQENLVMNWLITQDYEEDEAKEKLTDYKDSGLLAKEAKTAQIKLAKYEEKYQAELKVQTENNKKAVEKQVQDSIKSLENTISSKNEIIEGMPLNKDIKNKIFTGITKKDNKGFTEIQKKMSDPEMQLKVAQFVLVHNGSFDDIIKQAKTTVAKQTKKEVTTYKEAPSKLGQVDISVIKSAMKNALKK